MRIWAPPFPQMSKTPGCCMQTCTNTAKNRTEVSSNSLLVLKPVALGTLEHPQPCSERVCVCVCENHEALALSHGAQRAAHPSHVTHLARAHCWDLLLWQQQIIWFWLIRCVYVCVRVLGIMFWWHEWAMLAHACQIMVKGMPIYLQSEITHCTCHLT